MQSTTEKPKPSGPTQTYQITIHYKNHLDPHTIPRLLSITELGEKIFLYTNELVDRFEITPLTEVKKDATKSVLPQP